MRPSEAPDLNALSTLAPELASAFVSIAGDIALLIDADGVVRRVDVGASEVASAPAAWVGRRWAETVTDDTRQKIEQLLLETDRAGVSRRVEVNHPNPAGPEIPVAYKAMRLGDAGPVLAVGRDLRATAAIQQRFTESQQEMERGYWKLRQAESRYRLLFQVATDGVLVVDALTLAILEANHSAGHLLGRPPSQLVGQPATTGLDPASKVAVEALLASARAAGQPAEIRARLEGRPAMVELSATPFRGDGAMLLLVRVRAAQAASQGGVGQGPLADFVERMPDAVVITDSGGRVLMTNPAFLQLCGLSKEADARGSRLAEWVGQARDELPLLLAQARRLGIVPLAGATVRSERGPLIEVDVSAAMLTEGEQECIGFTIRRRAPRPAPPCAAVDELARAFDQLGHRVGRVALADLLREAGDLAEHHLLACAVERAGGNPADAAALLGITRDSLEQRRRRVAHLQRARGGDDPSRPLLN